ncbi:MAG: Flp pilus assembly complex ATPase component TadA [Firmicutes bacterium]|nr:Flp pilus assembly complex ATPase component TadA [Bacillota bacterium]
MVSEQNLQEAVAEQVTTHKRLGQILVEKDLITEDQLLEALERQLGVGHVDLNSLHLDTDLATSIPFSLASRHLVIPVEEKDGVMKLAMADPMNVIAVDDVELYTGLKVVPVIASESSITEAIDQLFSLAETASEDSGSTKQSEEEVARLRALVEEAPIVKVVNSLIHQAVREGASDIHIEPLEKRVRVRMRIDGVLQDLMTPPKDTQPLLISRIKIMANLDIAERRMPQDGRITIQVGLKDVNMRISTLPTIHGEKVVIRILDRDKVILPLDGIGFSENNYQSFLNFLLSHTGMILVTGPTGSGKTTTLYSALNYLNRVEDNIITVEDPVEYRLDGINQVQVNTRVNLTFATALRSILRQDPNIIMIGEIRDLETAEMATRAALTGHLVLSTLHTNDACSTVTRLIDMGVDSYLITSSLIGVVAQRLVRRICANCCEEYRLSDQEKALYRTAFSMEPPEELLHGRGCRQCNDTGYRGRFGLHEVLPLSREMNRLVLEGASGDALQRLAVEQGMVPLIHEGVRRIKNGETTVEEVVRVAYSGAGIDEMAAKTVIPVEADLAAEQGVEETLSPAASLELETSGPELVSAGGKAELSFAVHNSGSAPLSDIEITTPYFNSQWRHLIERLAPGQREQFNARLEVPLNGEDNLEALVIATARFGSAEVMAQSSLNFRVAQPGFEDDRL